MVNPPHVRGGKSQLVVLLEKPRGMSSIGACRCHKPKNKPNPLKIKDKPNRPQENPQSKYALSLQRIRGKTQVKPLGE